MPPSWIISHRAAYDAEPERLTFAAETPAEAIEQAKAKVPDGHALLSVRRSTD